MKNHTLGSPPPMKILQWYFLIKKRKIIQISAWWIELLKKYLLWESYYLCPVLTCLPSSLSSFMGPYSPLICPLYSSLCELQRERSALMVLAGTSTWIISNSPLPSYPVSMLQLHFSPTQKTGLFKVTSAPYNQLFKSYLILALPKLTPH